jgi:hypothetical protein
MGDLFVAFVIVFSIPLFLALVANPQLILPVAVAVPVFIFMLAVIEAALKG